MTDESDEGSGDADTPRARRRREPDPSRDRSGLVAGEAAAIARFGEGPALFAADIPAPRYPHVGPLLPRRRPHAAGSPIPDEARPAPAPSTALVRARRDLPARQPLAGPSAWSRAGTAARRGVEVVVDWTARGLVAAVDAVGTAAQAVVTLLFGPEQPARERA
ncbi:hypothetical protein [Actinomycetospora sp. TBRC 11914]|uniref:hypothetical protein n=1 Tax=Actinomycetospora sp. TBRC 11914 TaxID=2729387 RepID=UPI00145D3017|nr:hypothetical protein [Actinomycetospora sp. TBRC 11914]NMO93975.1 hypothetical protein [Actinomycetospora sp. TBRC 11914]